MEYFSLEDLQTYLFILNGDIKDITYEIDDVICIQNECSSNKLYYELQQQYETLCDDKDTLRAEKRYVKTLIKNTIKHNKKQVKLRAKRMRKRIDEYYASQSESDISRQTSGISRQSSFIRKQDSI